jgi:hypothetical protein
MKGCVVLLLLALLAGCRDETKDASKPPGLSEADLTRLHMLGYEPWVEETPEPGRKTGLVSLRPDRSFPGYTLFASRGAREASLLAPDGRLAHRWHSPKGLGFWSDTMMLADGTLLVVGATSDEFEDQPTARYLRALDWSSNVLWQSDFPAHHDVELTPDGKLLTLTFADREVDSPRGRRWVVDDLIVVASPQGRKLEQFSLLDLFSASADVVDLRWHPSRAQRNGHRVSDIFHANSVQWIVAGEREGTHPIFTDGNILVSIRHQDLIVVFDPRRRRLVWAWGRGELQGPHHARLLGSGNVIVFDNGLKRRSSRVVEMDPRSGEIVWQYDGDADNAFFTIGGGSGERLPNGNTLIAATAEGRLFEVTHEGEVVWHYINPIEHARRRGTIHAATRLPPAFVEPILSRRRGAS